MKQEYNEHMARVALMFESPTKIENLTLMVANTGDNGIDFNISPVKYDGAHPQIFLQIMSTDAKQFIPVATIFYDRDGKQKKQEFALPVYTNKFVDKVDMPPHIFDKYF